MKKEEYCYEIEKVYAEVMKVSDWLCPDDMFHQFVTIAMGCKSGSLVLENWKIYLEGGGEPDDFFEWWEKYRPDTMETVVEEKEEQPEEKEEVVKYVEGKKSPFDAVKKSVGMGGRE